MSEETGGGDMEGHAWPPVSFGRMRAGLRSALKTDCSGFKFQNGGRSVRWLREHFRVHDGLGGDARRDGPVYERTQLLWCGHLSLLETYWDDLGMDRVFGDKLVSQLVGPAPCWHEEMDRVPSMGSTVVEDTLQWLCTNPDHAVQFTQCLLPHCEPGADGRVDVPFGVCVLIAYAMARQWTWFVHYVREREQLIPCLLVAAVRAGDTALIEMYDDAARRNNCLPRTQALWMAAAMSGRVGIMEWVETNHAGCSWDKTTGLACTEGHLNVLEFIHHRAGPGLVTTRVHFGAACTMAAARAGRVHVLEWLYNVCPMNPPFLATIWAMERAQFGAIEFLHEHCRARFVNSGLYGLLTASRPNTLQMLEYLTPRGCVYMTAEALARAALAHNMRVDVLQYLLRHSNQDIWNTALAFPWLENEHDATDILRAAMQTVRRASHNLLEHAGTNDA